MKVKIVRMATAIATGVAAVMIALPSGAEAYSRVYVEDHTSSYWPLHSQVDWVDQWAGSDLIYGSCRPGYKCIRVYEVYFSTAYSGLTCLPNQWCRVGASYASYTRIYLNKYRRSYSWYARRNITAHELFHAVTGNSYHSTYCTNVMYGSVFCGNGSLPSHRFTDYAKGVLRQH